MTRAVRFAVEISTETTQQAVRWSTWRMKNQVTSFHLAIPDVAILGVSKSEMKPKWNGKDFDPRLMLPLSLSYDHRVIDGALAARFTVHVSGALSDLRRILL